jgi:hypothetical protein
MSTDAQPGRPQIPKGLDDAHAIALKRVKAKRDFEGHLVVYVVVNAFLILIWWWSGAGYFWPGWVLAGWGIGLAMNFFEAFVRKPITEADVQREMRRSGLG